MDEVIKKYRKKHGNVFTWKIGVRTLVIMCDFQTIKKVFNDVDASDRPDLYSLMIFSNYKRLGLFNVNGEIWHVGRRFTIRHLRDMGMGRSDIESSIAFEAQSLVENFSKHTDVPIKIPMSLSVSILNIIWKITADKRYDLDDQEILDFQAVVLQVFHDFQGNVALFDTFPYLVPITPSFVMERLGVKGYMDRCMYFLDFMRKRIAEHKKILNPDQPRDYIDAFLIEMQREENAGSETFTEENLAVSLADIFTAASETTSITLRWFILYMMKYPEIQRKVQEEIDSFVPRHRIPSLDDRPSLSFTNATLHELERVVSVTPLLATHAAARDMNINGFHVPKVDEFRFRKFCSMFILVMLVLTAWDNAFSGRRVCPGETVARQTMFIMGSALLHNYTFEAPDGAVLSTERDPMERLIIIPKPFKVIMRKRN
ncbi:Cytochrome P450 [Trinorchestia longiramus]|nr:Cytochrome P450 [Trinorchestia longiramus]